MLMNKFVSRTLGASFMFLFVGFAVTIFSPTASAATITVASGDDGIEVNGVCQLSEAVQNINNQAATNADCPKGDGSNDTVRLPAGSIRLTGKSVLSSQGSGQKSVLLQRNIKIIGQGQGRTSIDGDGLYGLKAAGMGDVTLQGLTLRRPGKVGIELENVAKVLINDVSIIANGQCLERGIQIIDSVDKDVSANLANVFVSDSKCSESGTVLAGIAVDNRNGGTLDFTAKVITIAQLNGSERAYGLVYGSNVFNSPIVKSGYGTIDAVIDNLTVDEITANDVAVGLAANIHNGSPNDATANGVYRNVTIRNVSSSADGLLTGTPAGRLKSRAVGSEVGSVSGKSEASVSYQNSLLLASKQGTLSQVCADVTYGPNSFIRNVTKGGNISDDDTCSSFLNDINDKNKQSGVSESLGKLSANGGLVPTILPNQDSIAVDAGGCSDAPAIDARGIARPQGSSCDSGAVEIQQASLASPQGIESAKKGIKVYASKEGTGGVFKVATISEVPQTNESDVSYPYGLVGFTLEGIPMGSTQTVSLYFETDEKAEGFTAQQYNTATERYQAVPDAQITNELRNGKPVIKLTYQVQDGGKLDIDGQANGSITDPVGLAKGGGILGTTSIASIIVSVVGSIILLGAFFTYLDYRKHKAPLLQMDKELNQEFAKKYTFWHHLKVVTIPTAKYKFTIRLEKKVEVIA